MGAGHLDEFFLYRGLLHDVSRNRSWILLRARREFSRSGRAGIVRQFERRLLTENRFDLRCCILACPRARRQADRCSEAQPGFGLRRCIRPFLLIVGPGRRRRAAGHRIMSGRRRIRSILSYGNRPSGREQCR